MKKEKTIKNPDGSETHFDYYANGNINSEYNYLNDKKHGICKGYYEDGNLLYQTNWLNGEHYGVSRVYYENGNLKSEHNDLGRIEIYLIEWHQDGFQSLERKFDENGAVHGKDIIIYENGNVYRIATYNHGELIEEKYFDEFTGEELED